ncbi:SixA phosphatase family protein [Desertibaculum subflavum]|uniref:SixA phosphatase family protein n=1 Tax=Desertibaculum subflavum TaxID=2268458 RepID=UPI000E66A809
MRHLYLLRHTKSAWDVPGQSDKERPLAPRGRKACRPMGRLLAALDPAPDQVLCSTAVRARQTWEGCAKAGGLDWPTSFRDDLYLATANQLLHAVRRLPGSTAAVLLVGHNPGMEELARALAGRGSDAAALARLAEKYPTGGFAAFAAPLAAWSDLAFGAARLVAFETPKRLEEG